MNKQPIIQVNKLVKHYPGAEHNAVDGLSFNVQAGEFFGFLGPNGAGKSTTMNVLVNLIKKTSGSVKIDGFEVSENPNQVYQRIGFAMQEIGLDDTATAREMLELHAHLYHVPNSEIKERIKYLLQLVELDHVADRFSGTFSGGMRRRLDLAISLIHEPKVLFLDEPTVGLDPHARQLIWQHLRKLNKDGMTIFLTTHFMEEAEELCDRIAIIDAGKIVAEGTPAELCKTHNGKNLEDVFIKVTGRHLREDATNTLGADPFIRNSAR